MQAWFTQAHPTACKPCPAREWSCMPNACLLIRLCRPRGPDSTLTGLAVEALQDQLPDVRVLYSSATGASEPDNLRYM
jgi:hypothetical protein